MIKSVSLMVVFLTYSFQVLLSLGFGGSESLSKIPERFLSHKSKAKGVTITNFVKKEEDLMNRFVEICVVLETFDCFLKV